MDKEFLKDFKKAGQIAAKARDYGASLIQEGARVESILDKVEQYILSQGAGIAFPAQISLNKVAAHACSPQDDPTIIQQNDVAKIDVGAHINGFVGDTARTINLNNEYKELISASKNALAKASTMMTAGTRVGDIGAAIQEEITTAGFQPIKNLSGHGLGKFQIHTEPQIPNIALPNTVALEEGMTVASEPFATDGQGAIAESGEPTVFSPVHMNARPRSSFAREILKKIQTYNGLPFASRWLSKEFGVGKTKLALRELERIGAVHSHPPLREIGNGMVSQTEHSFYITDNKPIISTKLDE